MTTWRQIYTDIMQVIEDPNAIAIGEPLVISFCELALNIALIRSKVLVKEVNNTIPFLAESIVPGFSYVPVVNIHTLLSDVSLILFARDGEGRRLTRIGFNASTKFEELFDRRDPLEDFFTIGVTLFGIRPMPEMEQEITITYIPYISVWDLDNEIPIGAEYREPLENMVQSLMLARLGHFDRAIALVEQALRRFDDIRRRPVRV